MYLRVAAQVQHLHLSLPAVTHSLLLSLIYFLSVEPAVAEEK